MHARTATRFGISILLGFFLFFFLASAARAGGPLLFDETTGNPVRWRNDRPIVYVNENPQAATLVKQAFDTWANVPIVDLQIQDGGLLEDLEHPGLQDLPAPLRIADPANISPEDFTTFVPCFIEQIGDTDSEVQRPRIECALIQYRSVYLLLSPNEPSHIWGKGLQEGITDGRQPMDPHFPVPAHAISQHGHQPTAIKPRAPGERQGGSGLPFVSARLGLPGAVHLWFVRFRGASLPKL